MASEALALAEATSRHDAVLAAWDGRRADYLRARTMADGPEVTPAGLIEALVQAAAPLDAAALADRAVARKAELGVVALDAAALLALRARQWEAAEALAGEVTARDHHDLLAQRIVDAARARSTGLELEVDRWLGTRFCPAPFEQIDTRTTGAVHFCCSAWQPVPIGNLTEPLEAIWNSAAAGEIRRSVIEGDFSHCSRWHCPLIAARRLPPRRPSAPAVVRPTEVAEPPKRVNLAHDRSCNLACPSCRVRMIQLGHAGSDALNRLFEEKLLPLVSQARSIKVTGSGDPFGSRHFRYVLGRLCETPGPPRRLQLHTNGLLFDERAWRELGLAEHVDSVWVTTDATRAETYAEVRGGDFGLLRRNLAFIGALRRAGAFNSYRLDFVVQQRNYPEMGELVDLARRVGADGVYFLRLRNWGHFTPERFRAMDVCDPAHPEHGELMARLADPRLLTPGVELGSMAGLVAKAIGSCAIACGG